MSDQAKEILARTDAFRPLNEDERAAIADLSVIHEFSNGDRLFKDGEPAKYMWVISEGTIDLRFELPGRKTSEENTISTLSDNQIIGWSSLIPPYQYKLSAYCVSKKCLAMKINAEQLLDYLRQNPGLGYRVLAAMIRVVGKRFQQLQISAGQAPIAGAKVTVHMGTCGITAGARAVMTALTEEMARTTRQNIQVLTGGCIGRCPTEPNVTVAIEGEDPVVYQFMDAEKMRRVFKKHVIWGEVQAEFTSRREQS